MSHIYAFSLAILYSTKALLLVTSADPSNRSHVIFYLSMAGYTWSIASPCDQQGCTECGEHVMSMCILFVSSMLGIIFNPSIGSITDYSQSAKNACILNPSQKRQTQP